MSEIIISSYKTMEDIRNEFQHYFPYLELEFLHVEDCYSEEPAGYYATPHESEYPIDSCSSLRKYQRHIPRSPRPKSRAELFHKDLSIHGNTQVIALKEYMLNTYNIRVYIGVEDPYEGTYDHTLRGDDELTFSVLNKIIQQAGYRKYPMDLDGMETEELVRTDIFTRVCQNLHLVLTGKITGISEVNWSKPYAKRRRTHLYREYYADISDDEIEAFFIEWDPEEVELYIGFNIIPPKKDRRLFKDVLKDRCTDIDAFANGYSCFTTYSNFASDDFFNVDGSYVEEAIKLYRQLKKIRKEILKG